MKLSNTRRLERLHDRYLNGGLDRRAFLGLTAAAATSVGLSMPWMGRALAAVTEVRFDGWGGTVQDALDKYAFQPYAKKTGIKVVQGTFGDENEIITKITFPEPSKAAYVKFPNPASRYALVGVFVAKKGGQVRVAVTGAGSEGVFRHAAMEEALSRRFSPKSLDGIATDAGALNSDIHASADYRAHLIGVMARRAVAAAS